MSSTYPFVVNTSEDEKYFWVVNDKTGQEITHKFLDKEIADEFARQLKNSLTTAPEEILISKSFFIIASRGYQNRGSAHSRASKLRLIDQKYSRVKKFDDLYYVYVKKEQED